MIITFTGNKSSPASRKQRESLTIDRPTPTVEHFGEHKCVSSGAEVVGIGKEQKGDIMVRNELSRNIDDRAVSQSQPPSGFIEKP